MNCAAALRPKAFYLEFASWVPRSGTRMNTNFEEKTMIHTRTSILICCFSLAAGITSAAQAPPRPPVPPAAPLAPLAPRPPEPPTPPDFPAFDFSFDFDLGPEFDAKMATLNDK